MIPVRPTGLLLLLAAAACPAQAAAPGVFDVRAYGAVGDGQAIDTPAVNRAIDAAAAAGGGTVAFPAGTYRCYSIHLRSHLTLRLGAGATLLAGPTLPGVAEYDPAEPNPNDLYQDFGHSHWHTGFLWGVDLEDVTIEGPGTIYGAGLTKFGPGPSRPRKDSDTPLSLGARKTAGNAEFPPGTQMKGQGDKAIALKNCRNVILRGFTIRHGGHFAILASGVSNLTLENLKIDTNRDAFDIDCCRHVRISDCAVNTPNDDAICLKSSYALGEARPTQDVTITGCQVSGFDEGTFLDGTCRTEMEVAPDRDRATGRIKFGTESNGGLKNVAISDCVFVHCRGLALESVDGGPIEDIAVSNLTMRDVTTAPLFIRLGVRQRGPADSPVSTVRRISIRHLDAFGIDPRYPALIAGIPGHPIEDVSLSDIRLVYRGGGTAAQAAAAVPENANSYPEPSMFGVLPAYGLFARHVAGLTADHVSVSFLGSEARPAIVLDDVAGADLSAIGAERAPGAPAIVLRRSSDFSLRDSPGLPDVRRAAAADESLQ